MDNHAMWQDLGMDVKTHDLLCEALPQAFGDVYLSQKNRPKAMDYFNMVVADIHGIRPAELVAFRKKGGKVVGSFCIHVPDGVVIAGGAIEGLPYLHIESDYSQGDAGQFATRIEAFLELVREKM